MRYLRARGEDVVYVCGTDEHGVPITLTAEREGKSPREVVDYWWAHMKETFERFDISFDNFSRTSDRVARQEHPALLPQAQGGRLHLGGGVQADVQPDGGTLPARPLRRGDVSRVRLQGGQGRPVRQLRILVRGLRAHRAALQDHGRTRRGPRDTHLYLDLPKFSERLREYVVGQEHWRSSVKNFILGIIDGGLEKRPYHARHPVGRPRSRAGLRGQALLRLVRRLHRLRLLDGRVGRERRGAGQVEGVLAGAETRLIHFIGKDNTVFHTLIWPAQLMGTAEDGEEPSSSPTTCRPTSS